MLIEYTVLQGDSIHRIAQNLLGSSDFWIDIVEHNQLDYPFILDEIPEDLKKMKIATIGDILEIPIRDAEGVTRYADAEDELFGTDIILFPSNSTFQNSICRPGGFNVDGHGDIATVTGEMCLYQDLIHQLMTPKGSLLLHPQYGSDFLQYVGTKGTTDNIRKASIELQRTFLSDSRVTGVTNVNIFQTPNSLHIDCEIQSIAGDFKWKYAI